MFNVGWELIQKREDNLRKGRLLMVIFLLLTVVSVYSSSLEEKFLNDDSGLILHSYKNYTIIIFEETGFNPKIIANVILSNNEYNFGSSCENLNTLLVDFINIAKEIENAKINIGKRYDNIYISCDYAFRSNIILDFKNRNLYLPKYYNEISYIINNFKTTDEDKLLSNKESYDFFYYNGFLNHDKNGFNTLGYNTIDSGYSVFIVDGQFKSYNSRESMVIKLSIENSQIKESDLISRTRKSYWGEGNWLVSKRYDDFADSPIYEISQSTSSTYDRANVWLNIRYSGHKLETYINFSTNVSLDDSTTVTYRINDMETVYNEKWNPSTSKTAVFYPKNAKEFIKELMNSNRIIFLVESKYHRYKFEIDTNGLSKTIDPYLETFNLL